MTTGTFLETVSLKVSESLGKQISLRAGAGGGFAGGGGASTSVLVDESTQTKYFIKSAYGASDMLTAEYYGVKAMSETNTVRVPTPVAYGTHGTEQAFVAFEYLHFCSGGSGRELGINLAKMHKHFSPNGKFGFDIDNTIGATYQPNGWHNEWPAFWDQHRLGNMLKLTHDAGFDKGDINDLRVKTKELLSHRPDPSLLHGDLWGGNKGYAREKDGTTVPVIFDPATYYGDRESDIAMTYLFGGFGPDFYEGYQSEWPLPAGHEKRRIVYNLYHILNHEVLFGGYEGQARNMMRQIMTM